MRIVAAPADVMDGTRSVLDETAEFEDMVKSMTIAAFDSGTGYLVGCVHRRSGEFDISLPMDRSYRIYLLANMGDRTGDIPNEMSAMQSFSYDIESYSRLKDMGLPMVCVEDTPWTPELELDLRRLMAKLVITVDKSDIADMGGGGEESFRNHRIAVHRVARVLYPFATGGSAAKSAEDLFVEDGIEFDLFADETAANSEEMLLYVPENMQEADTDPAGKELCTYVSMNGYKDGTDDGVYGRFVYRFFPESDNTSALKGGRRYDVTLKLTWNGMYMEGDWKVERSDWSDNRRIFVSIAPDRGYDSSVSTSIARGSVDVPVYIYYSPQGKEYEGGADHHDKGWVFQPMYSFDGNVPISEFKENTDEFAGVVMSSGFVEHTDCWTKHYVTIPASTYAGYGNTMFYVTRDRRERAVLKIKVTQPVIEFSPLRILSLFHEYGYESRRTIRVNPASPVRPCNITVYTRDNNLITLGDFNPETGKVDVYWNDTNTSSSDKIARVYLHSEACGVTSVCTLVQKSRPDLSIDGEMEGGGADIEY